MQLTYFQNLNRLILSELEIRSNYFANNYSCDKQSMVLVSSGAGGRLLQSEESYFPGQPYPSKPAFRECRLTIISVLAGDILQLELNSDELDWENRPVIASVK